MRFLLNFFPLLILQRLTIISLSGMNMEMDLKGTWEIAPVAKETWEEARPPSEEAAWEEAAQPNHYWTGDKGKGQAGDPYHAGAGVWAKRSFNLDAEQAGMDAALRWEIIKWGFAAYLNGEPLGETELYSPGSMPVPRGLLKAGENELLLKVRNYAAVARSGTYDKPLVPAGSALFGWGAKTSGILGYVRLDFFKKTRLRSLLMEPDIEKGAVTARLRLETVQALDKPLEAQIEVLDAGGKQINAASWTVTSEQLEEGQSSLTLPMPDFKLWALDDPVLYTARVFLKSGGEILSAEMTRFGMRSFETREGKFFLNGEPFYLRGSNVVGEWNWRDEIYRNRDEGLRTYLIGKAKAMNLKGFRTHTLPPAGWPADICDEGGTLLMAEMPLTYNYQPTGFNEEETERYRRNAVLMNTAWVEELANHPSIIMWVSTNEPIHGDDFNQAKWDNETLIPAMKAVDPTRPVMRSGEMSPDVFDTHCYSGFWEGAWGDFEEHCRRQTAARDGRRPVMNSEYIENLPPERRWRWLGSEDWTVEAALFYATVGLEQTEALRRHGYDGILPYMFRPWTRGRWREDAPTPMFAALRSALAPAAVSVDLPDRNFPAGKKLAVEVWVMNDINEKARAALTCYVCPENPEFTTESSFYKKLTPVFHKAVELNPREIIHFPVAFQLPDKEGACWLAAVLKPEGRAAVMSQRPVMLWAKNAVPATAAKRRYRLLGAGKEALKWFGEKGLRFDAGPPFAPLGKETGMVVIWENAEDAGKSVFIDACVNRYLWEGGRVLLMRQPSWKNRRTNLAFPNGDPLEFGLMEARASTAFQNKAAGDEAIWQGIPQGRIHRWNGFFNCISQEAVAAPFFLDCPPAEQSPEGPISCIANAVIIEGESPAETNFAAGHPDPYFLREKDGRLAPLPFRGLRGGKCSLLCAREKPARDYFAVYEFECAKAVREGFVWVFEQGRAWASPFRWRIDDGPWRSAGMDIPMRGQTAVSDAGTTFAWSRLGKADLTPGRHRLEIRVNEAKKNGDYLLAQDCFIIAPQPGETLAVSGDEKKPVLARLKIGRGELLITQLLIADRLPASSSAYDPLAERFFLNLLSY